MMSNEGSGAPQSADSVSRRRMKRYGIPAALLAGGLALGSVVMPIGLANAQDGTGQDAPAQNMDRHGGPGGRMGVGPGGEVVQELLGLTGEEIHTALDSGRTLAELAESKGVSQADLVAALVSEATARIDQAVADGRFDEARAAEMKADLEARITERVTTVHQEGDGPDGPGGRMGPSGHHEHGSMPDLDSATGTTEG